MDFEQLIAARQSCRNYSDKEVSKEDILACLEAAHLAPSACNAQPFHITVCTGPLARETAACTQVLGLNKFAVNVPCFLVFSEENYNLTAAAGHILQDHDFRGFDTGIAVGMLTLAATARGLSTCILGAFDEKKLQKLLDIRRRIHLIVALGWAAEGDPLRPKKRKSMAELADFR